MALVDKVEEALRPLTIELVGCCIACGDPIFGSYTEVGCLPFKVCHGCIYEAALALHLIQEDFA